MSLKFSVFQVSRKGGRAKNEDRMGYCYTRESALFVLADGMGAIPMARWRPTWRCRPQPMCFSSTLRQRRKALLRCCRLH